MDKESSDKVAGIAARILRGTSPIDDDALMDQIVRNVTDAVQTGTPEMAREAIREPLREHFNNARTLAASVVSQADGPE